MHFSSFKKALPGLTELRFVLPEGTEIPLHVHLTEVGLVQRSFIDCGNTIRHEKTINLQLWEAEDDAHRLAPGKLLGILRSSEQKLQLPDLEVEVEYQAGTIGRYGLRFAEGAFHLVNKKTDCLAKETCGLPADKPRHSLSSLGNKTAEACTPGSACCA